MSKGIIRFTKMQGCGNDYIYIDTSVYEIPDPQAAAIAWSRPHKGIGSDGLVLIGRSSLPEADFTMRIFNADGSEAMMCGNACRCIGKYVYDRGLTDKTFVRLLTPSGVKMLKLNVSNHSGLVESVTVDMGAPNFNNTQQYVPTGDECSGCFISMGNPHYVIFVDDIAAVDVATEGKRLEHHPQFPERSNIEFAEVRPNGIRMRVWERGSGITMACGTGACATAVAAALTHRAGRNSTIIMDGGSLDIEWRKDDNHILMTGPADFVYDGEIRLEVPLNN